MPNIKEPFKTHREQNTLQILQEVREKLFFEVEYNKRKFLTDQDVFQDKYLTNYELDKIYCDKKYNRYTSKEIFELFDDYVKNTSHLVTPEKDIYDILRSHQNYFLYLFLSIYGKGVTQHQSISLMSIVSPQRNQHEIYNLNFNTIDNTILDKIFQGNWQTYISNIKNFASDMLLFDISNLDLLHIFFIVSCKYGIYISDILRTTDIDNILKNINGKLQINYIIHPRFIDMIRNSENEKLTNSSIKMNRMKDIIINNHIKRNERSTYNNILKSVPYTGSYSSNSFKNRLIGLWLWDKVYGVGENTNSQISAICEFRKKYPQFDNFSSNDSSISNFKRLYSITKKCIKKGKILPIK